MNYRGVSFPFRLVNGRFAMSEANAKDNTRIREAIYTIIATRMGERLNESDFGSRGLEIVFSPSTEWENIAEEIRQQIITFITYLESVKVEVVENEGGILIFNVSYTAFGSEANELYRIAQ